MDRMEADANFTIRLLLIAACDDHGEKKPNRVDAGPAAVVTFDGGDDEDAAAKVA